MLLLLHVSVIFPKYPVCVGPACTNSVRNRRPSPTGAVRPSTTRSVVARFRTMILGFWLALFDIELLKNRSPAAVAPPTRTLTGPPDCCVHEATETCRLRPNNLGKEPGGIHTKARHVQSTPIDPLCSANVHYSNLKCKVQLTLAFSQSHTDHVVLCQA